MGKRKKYRKPKTRNTPKKNRSKKTPSKAENISNQNLQGERPIVRLFRKWWKRISIVFAIITVIPAILFIKDRFFKTDYQKFDEKNPKGTIEFPQIPASNIADNNNNSDSNNIELEKRFIYDYQTYHYPEVKGIYVKNLENMRPEDVIEFQGGTNTFGVSKKQLDKGVQIDTYFNACTGGANVWAIARKNRIYISAKFVDLKTDDEIGEMEFNHWKIYNGEFMDYTPGKDRFEVKDKQGYIVFSIADVSSEGKIRIAVSGYFNRPNFVSIFTDQAANYESCIPKGESNWRKKAEIAVATIKSVFPVKKP